MKWRIFILLVFGLVMTAAFGQTDSTVRVNQFPGSNVGAKVTAAMASCTTNTAVPCFIVIDASLAAANPGVLPTLCGHCYLIDYRSGLPWGGGGAIVHGPGHTVQYANTGVTGLDSDPQFSYDASTHTLLIGGAIVGNSFTLKNLGSIPSSWTLDVTSPATARASLGIGGAGTQNVPDGCLYGVSGTLTGTGGPCASGGAAVVIAQFSGMSCTLADDAGEGSGCQGTITWGTTISGSYTAVCEAGYLSSGSNVATKSRFTVNEVSHDATTYTYIIDNMQSASRGSAVTLSCIAVQ